MRIIIIRHAEPDYEHGTLTEKGMREAALLADRISKWNVTEFFCSPISRAQLTAEPTLKALGRTAATMDWLREFDGFVHDDSIAPNQELWPWDFMPEYLEAHQELFTYDECFEKGIYTTGPVKARYEDSCNEMDKLLAKYGYVRDGLIYRSPKDRIATNHYMVYDGNTLEHMKDAKVDENTLVFFCHQEIAQALIAHLTNIPLNTMWQGFFLPTSSVTVLGSEERVPGQAIFRCQVFGDTSHLLQAQEPISYYGNMTSPFQG